MKLNRLVARVVTAAFLSQTVACYDWVGVKPTELPKLNGAYADGTQYGNVRVITYSVADLQRPDGSLIQIKGAVNVMVYLRSGEAYEFEKPVQAEIQGEELVMRASNRGETHMPFANIDHAEVRKLNAGATTGVIVGVSLGVATILGVITYAILSASVKSVQNSANGY